MECSFCCRSFSDGENLIAHQQKKHASLYKKCSELYKNEIVLFRKKSKNAEQPEQKETLSIESDTDTDTADEISYKECSNSSNNRMIDFKNELNIQLREATKRIQELEALTEKQRNQIQKLKKENDDLRSDQRPIILNIHPHEIQKETVSSIRSPIKRFNVQTNRRPNERSRASVIGSTKRINPTFTVHKKMLVKLQSSSSSTNSTS